MNLKSVAKMYGISPCTVRKWAYAYQEHEIIVLTGKKGRYSADFKRTVVRIPNCPGAHSTIISNVLRLRNGISHARDLVLKIYHQPKGRYDYKRIRLACRNEGILLNRKTVRKLMKELDISRLIRVNKVPFL